MPGPIAAPQVHATPLNFDFGHSPVGNLGGRSVQQVPAQAPRSIGQAFSDFFSGVKSLGERLLDIVTPHGVRGESKFRAGLEATSSQVGELIGALSKSGSGPVDGLRARQILDSLAGTAEPVTSRGVPFDEVFKQRVDVHLKNMTTPQLVSLQQGLAMAGNSALKGEANLAVLGNALKLELAGRLVAKALLEMKPALEKALAEVPHGGGAVSYAYDDLYGIAAQLLESHGRESGRDLQRALIKEALNSLVDDGTLDLRQTGEMLKALPSRELRDLLQTGTTIGRDAPFTAERLLTGSVGVRAEQSEKAFLAGAEKLLGHKEPTVDDPQGPLHNPRGFAREIVDVARHLDELRSHCQIHDLKFGEGVDSKVAQVHAHLEELLRPSNLLLGELNHSQLNDLSQALKKLGIERGSSQIAGEIARRKEEVVTAYNTAMQAAIGCAQRGDLGGLLKALDQAQAKANEALQTHQKLGERIDDTDKIMAFRERLVAAALRDCSPQQLGELFALLSSPTARTLMTALGEAGQDLLPGMSSIEGRDPGLGKRLFDAAIDLQMLKLGVDTALKAQGLKLPPLPDERQLGLGDLDDAGRAAVREAFGVDVSPSGMVNVRIGTGGPGVQRLFEDNLRAVLEGPGTPYRLEGGESTGVSDGLWLDLPRARYAIRQDDGTARSLLDTDNLAPGGTPERVGQLLGGVDQLRALCGGSPALLMALSRLANQNLLAGIQQALMSGDSPIRLPDGTPGRLMGPERITYTVGSDGEGGLVLRCDYAIHGATHFMDPATGRVIELEPGGSGAHFTLEVAIGPDGQARVSDPVQFLYDLQPKA